MKTKTELDKERFDWLRRITKGGRRRMGCCWSGKNRNQRARLSAAFSGFYARTDALRRTAL